MAVLVLAAAALAGCEMGFKERDQQRHGASVMEYLYPGESTTATVAPADLTQLRVPLRIGVAFVPSGALASAGATDTQQQQLLAGVVKAFERYPFVGELKMIPSQYLRAAGGFPDLQRAATVFDVDVVALLSYDQVQFTEKNRASAWYWTLIGAYVVNGDQYDVHTLIEASVMDVKSRRLLFRAAGTSVAKGESTMSNIAEATRAARSAGFRQAVDQLIPNLQAALAVFREKARAGTAAGVDLKLPPGYDPSASRPAR